MTFHEFGLSENLIEALAGDSIEIPTPVQEQAIPVALSGKDVIVSARTGTGKTLAYGLPVVTHLVANPGKSALVLVPTRELAVQVHGVLAKLLKAERMGFPVLLIGGVSYSPQIMGLRKKPAIIVATPGRALDHLQSGSLDLSQIQALILDEADRMLDMGFIPQVRSLLKKIPTDRQTLLFTATVPKDLRSVIRDLLRDPTQIFVDPPSTTNVSIEQKMIDVDQNAKFDALLNAVNEAEESVLVFSRTKRRTDKVAQYLDSFGVKTERIHGDRSQAQRQKAIDMFRRGKVKVLVATDIAARGLDIPLVELVVNFDLPGGKEDYVHRIGRTGRAGAKGVALSFVSPEEKALWAYVCGKGKSVPPPDYGDRRGGRRPGGRPGAGASPRRTAGGYNSERPARFTRNDSFAENSRSGFSQRRDGFAPKRDGFAPKRDGFAREGFGTKNNDFIPRRDGFAGKSAGFARRTPFHREDAFAGRGEEKMTARPARFVRTGSQPEFTSSRRPEAFAGGPKRRFGQARPFRQD